MKRAGIALILSPSTALAVQSILYSLVTPSCARQSALWLHATAAAGLAVVLVLGLLAASNGLWPRGDSLDSDDAQLRTRRRFLSAAGTAVSALSAAVILAMWLGVGMLSPCAPWP